MNIEEGAKRLKNGEVIIFPTETLYGLAADAFNENAVKQVFALKQRPPNVPLLVLISDTEMLAKLVAEIPPQAEAFMQQFWPGPLTLVFKKGSVPDIVTAGKDTIAVRMERHPIARELVAAVGPLVAPSANISGKEPPATAEAAKEHFPNLFAINGGIVQGIASTIVSVVDTPILLREGEISFEELHKVDQDIKKQPSGES